MDGLAGPPAPAAERARDGGRATIHGPWGSATGPWRGASGSAGPDQQCRHPGQGAGQEWLQVQPLSDDVLEGRLYGRRCCYQEPLVRNRTKRINLGSALTRAYSGSPTPSEYSGMPAVPDVPTRT